MKNFGRKMLGLILAIAMVCSILPVAVMATPTTDGYALKFEYADNTAAHGFSQERTNAVFSGGSANQAVAGTTEYYIDFMADISKAGDYTIWVRGGQHGSGWASNIKITVDGETVLPELGNTTGSFWANSYGINHQMAFQSTTATFTAGSHTIRYELDGVAPNNTSYYLGAFDCMVIMPTNYTWTPAIDTMPTAPTLKEFDEDGYGWFEETDYSTKHGYFNQNLSNAAYSGGKALAVNQADYADNYLDFYINVPKAGTYDIWVYGTSTNNWASAPKLLLNGVEQTLTSMSGETWNGNYVSQWKKVSGLSLTAGEVDIKYLLNVSRASGTTNYIGVFDVICIVPVSWGWTYSFTKPVKPTFYANAWIEGENYTTSNYVTFNNSTSLTALSGGSTHQLHVNGAAPSGTGYYSDYTIKLQEGTYDIYFRGVDDTYSTWMSNATPYVDGVEETYTNVKSEGWNPSGLSDYAHGWMKVSGVTVTEDDHTIRWAYLEPRASGAAACIGGLDCIAIVPTGAPFTPVGGNITNTKLDYYMSLLMLDQDLTNITEDITLPTTLEDSTAVSWASSNTTAIATNGAVIRPINSDANVTLTATAGGYSKAFAATVKYTDEFEITGFNIGGSTTAGGTTTATATVKRNGGANGTATLILAIYKNGEEMIGVDIANQTVNLTPQTLNCSVNIGAGQTGTLFARAFLWTDFSELRPITLGRSTN